MAGAIIVEGISKRFRRWEPTQAMTLQELVQRGFRWRPRDYFWALADVSFRVNSGRMVGIMGFNGAGKSTLLRLVAGVGRPTRGRVDVQGRLGAILDLGVGFHPELTGRENVFVSGVCSGLTRREVADRFDSIVAFSELESFLDYPLRTYSSGMNLRLAFAVAVHIEPEVLLIDEVLAVGDMAFQKKCTDRMRTFKKNGCTGLIVSHAPQSVLALCDEAIWLDRGRIVTYGPAADVVAQYVEATAAGSRPPRGQSREATDSMTGQPVAESLDSGAERGPGAASSARITIEDKGSIDAGAQSLE
jgi:lipopolysaccharide transport system ATP-binding protein